jgi:hypothetical protein
MKNIIAIIYWMFITNNNSIPYFRALLLITLGLLLHIAQIIILTSIITGHIFLHKSAESRPIQWLWGSIYLMAALIILSVIYSKKKLDRIVISQKAINRAKWVIPVYFIFSIFLFTILIIIYKKLLFPMT